MWVGNLSEILAGRIHKIKQQEHEAVDLSVPKLQCPVSFLCHQILPAIVTQRHFVLRRLPRWAYSWQRARCPEDHVKNDHKQKNVIEASFQKSWRLLPSLTSSPESLTWAWEAQTDISRMTIKWILEKVIPGKTKHKITPFCEVLKCFFFWHVTDMSQVSVPWEVGTSDYNLCRLAFAW